MHAACQAQDTPQEALSVVVSQALSVGLQSVNSFTSGVSGLRQCELDSAAAEEVHNDIRSRHRVWPSA